MENNSTTNNHQYVIIKEAYYADHPGSTLSVVGTAPTLDSAHSFCQKACAAECDALNEGTDAYTPLEGGDETLLPDGFRWDDSWEDEHAEDRYQYVVRLWTGNDSSLVSGFCIREIESEDTDAHCTSQVADNGHVALEGGQYLSINGYQVTVQQIADMLGLEGTIKDIRLSQPLPSGILSAELDPWQRDYPGIDLVLEVPGSQLSESDEILVARCEQDAEAETDHPIKAYLYARCGEYIATKELDIRNDEEFEEGEEKPERLVVGGGYAIGPLEVFYEAPHFFDLRGQYKGPENS